MPAKARCPKCHFVQPAGGAYCLKCNMPLPMEATLSEAESAAVQEAARDPQPDASAMHPKDPSEPVGEIDAPPTTDPHGESAGAFVARQQAKDPERARRRQQLLLGAVISVIGLVVGGYFIYKRARRWQKTVKDGQAATRAQFRTGPQTNEDELAAWRFSVTIEGEGQAFLHARIRNKGQKTLTNLRVTVKLDRDEQEVELGDVGPGQRKVFKEPVGTVTAMGPMYGMYYQVRYLVGRLKYELGD